MGLLKAYSTLVLINFSKAVYKHLVSQSLRKDSDSNWGTPRKTTIFGGEDCILTAFTNAQLGTLGFPSTSRFNSDIADNKPTENSSFHGFLERRPFSKSEPKPFLGFKGFQSQSWRLESLGGNSREALIYRFVVVKISVDSQFADVFFRKEQKSFSISTSSLVQPLAPDQGVMVMYDKVPQVSTSSWFQKGQGKVVPSIPSGIINISIKGRTFSQQSGRFQRNVQKSFFKKGKGY